MPEAMKAAGTGDFWSTRGMLCLQVESLCIFFSFQKSTLRQCLQVRKSHVCWQGKSVTLSPSLNCMIKPAL